MNLLAIFGLLLAGDPTDPSSHTPPMNHAHSTPAPGLPEGPESGVPADIVISVDGMVCSFCVQGVERTMRRIDAVADVALSLESKTISLWLKSGQDVEDEFLKKQIKASGFDATAVTRPTPPTEPVQ